MKAPHYKAILRLILFETDDPSVISRYKNVAMVQDKLKSIGWEPLMAAIYNQDHNNAGVNEDKPVEVETSDQTVTIEPPDENLTKPIELMDDHDDDE